MMTPRAVRMTYILALSLSDIHSNLISSTQPTKQKGAA